MRRSARTSRGDSAHPIHVRVDPMLHPEQSRIDLVQTFTKRRVRSCASATSTR